MQTSNIRISLFLGAIFLAFCRPAAAAETGQYKASYYNILSIIHNNYITPVDNWTILNGALKGIQEMLGDKPLQSETTPTEILVSVANNPPLQLKKTDIDNNAYNLLEAISLLSATAADTQPGQVPQNIMEAAIKGIVSTLDSHSSFISGSEYYGMRAKNDGIFGGIGVELIIRDKALIVVSPFEGTPAHRAGLKANDRILAINGETTDDLPLQTAVSKIRGPNGSIVKLSVKRADWPSPREISIVRDVTKLHSVKSSIVKPGFIAVQIISFLETTVTDTKKILQAMEENGGIRGLILDFRNNPGGLLEQSIDIADLFLDTGTIVFSKDNSQGEEFIYVAKRDRIKYTFPLVLLVNEGSASGTEIVAAALKDNNRALILGTRTFGKGTIQTIFPVMNNAALRLTTAEFFTPGGQRIEHVGIPPHLIVSQPGNDDNTKNKGLNTSASDGSEKDQPHIFLEQGDDALFNLAIELLECAATRQQTDCLTTVTNARK